MQTVFNNQVEEDRFEISYNQLMLYTECNAYPFEGFQTATIAMGNTGQSIKLSRGEENTLLISVMSGDEEYGYDV